MSLPKVIPTFPEYDVTIAYTVTKRIKAASLDDAERTANLIMSTLKDAKLHSVIRVEQEKQDGKR